MDALEAFQKAQIEKTKAELDMKMSTNKQNRENHFRELRNRLKENNNKVTAAVEANKIKPLHPPPWPVEHSN